MNEQKQIFEVQRVYVNKSTFELLNPEEIFLLQWQPKVEFELKTTNKQLKDINQFEVVIDLNAKVSIADKQICNLQVAQAGIFRLEGFNEEQQKQILNGHCPDILYPYACYKVSHLFTEASLPTVQLKPMSFVALYQQNLANPKKEEKHAKKENLN